MTSRASQSLAARALRNGLMLAVLGVLVALTLYFSNPWIGFPAWAIPLWPTALLMMGLSGISERAAEVWTVAILASNGLWYFAVGAILTPPIILTWRALARLGVKSDDGYKIRPHGRNTVRVSRGKEEMFVFVEPLATTPASYQVDTSQVWLDAKFTTPLGDPHLATSVIEMVVAYFQRQNIGVEVR